MGAVLKLEFEGRRLHAQQRGGLVWFLHAEACDILDLVNPRDVAANQVKAKHLHVGNTYTERGHSRQAVWISEAGLYRLAVRSSKPVGERFAEWLFEEVLPEIRRTGSFRGGSGPLDDLISSFQPELPLPPVKQPMLRIVPSVEPAEEREWDIQDYMDADAPMGRPTRREIFQEVYAAVDYAVTVTHRGYPWDIRIMRADSNWCREPQSVYLPTDPVVLVTWDWARTPPALIYKVLDRLGVNSPLVKETLDANIFDPKRRMLPSPRR